MEVVLKGLLLMRILIATNARIFFNIVGKGEVTITVSGSMALGRAGSPLTELLHKNQVIPLKTSLLLCCRFHLQYLKNTCRFQDWKRSRRFAFQDLDVLKVCPQS